MPAYQGGHVLLGPQVFVNESIGGDGINRTVIAQSQGYQTISAKICILAAGR